MQAPPAANMLEALAADESLKTKADELMGFFGNMASGAAGDQSLLQQFFGQADYKPACNGNCLRCPGDDPVVQIASCWNVVQD